MRLVLVEWWDAVGPADMEPGEKLPPLLAKTVGYLYEDAEDYITIAAEIFEADSTFRACTTIPRCSITAIRQLRGG
jgi:hypothetical protein